MHRAVPDIQPVLARSLPTALPLIVLVLLCGCVSIQPARVQLSAGADARPESSAPPLPGSDRVDPEAAGDSGDAAGGGGVGDQGGIAWPIRWGQPGSARGVLLESKQPAELLRPAHLGRFHSMRVGPTEYRHAEALAEAVGKQAGFRFEPEGPGSLVFVPPMDAPEQPVKEEDRAAQTLVFVSAQALPGDAMTGEERIALERTWIACYDPYPPTPEAVEDAVGTIVLVPGMLGTPEPIIEGMVRYWRRAGFSVVRLLSHPSRFTERVEVEIAEGDEPTVGRRLAEVYDQRSAECAYAVDAGLVGWLERRPVLAERPIVYVGMSGGAIVGPAVLSYTPDRYDAAVLIAGGVDFFSISATSNYADWIDAVSLDWAPDDPDTDGKPTPERLSRVADAYLEASVLDGMHRAGDVGIPTLLLHAKNDRAVPSRFGQTLWHRLGRPERWSFPVGHELIFVMLPTQASRLDAWIRDAVGIGAEPPAEAGSP